MSSSVAPASPRVLVKSGGFATQLMKYVGAAVNNDPLWGSRCSSEYEKAIIQTHWDFLESGADILLSNTYQASVEGLMEHMGLTREAALDHMRKSVRLAKQAREAFLKKQSARNLTAKHQLPLIMGSIGPYGACLHDGSEYTGAYAEQISKEDLQKWHRPRIESCLLEGVDGLAVETIPCRKEAEAVAELLVREYAGTNFWISFQCKDESSLASGENFSEAVLSIWNFMKAQNALSNLLAIGMNCCSPKIVAPLFKSLPAQHEFAASLIVYSNSGETWNAQVSEWQQTRDMTPLENYIPEWLSLGVKIVGGCCRVYPGNIARIKEAVQKYLEKNQR